MPQFDTTFRVSDVFVICGALFVVGRIVINKIAHALSAYEQRLTLHEQALEQAGWLARDNRGTLIVATPRHPQQAGA